MRQLFTEDERGVSEVIGAVLVFGLLIALMAVMQTYAVPAANEEVEFNHNQEVQSDMVEFHELSTSVAAGGSPESTHIQMGTNYPARMIFFNPTNPSGEISVAGDQTATLRNVQAQEEHVDDYIDGSPVTGLQTKRLEYRPHYNEYENPPTTVLEYGAVYRDFGDQVVVDDPGQIISGNTISLTFYNGNMSRTAGGSMSLEAQATSAPARSVTVTNTSNPIVLELPSNLNASKWNETLSEEENVQDVRDGGNGIVEVELKPSESYNLRMAQIGVGSGVPTPEAHYVTRASNRQLNIGESNQLPIEVRDRYNNPVSGATLNITVEEGEFANGQKEIQTTTTEDGRPAAQYYGNGAGVDTVRASIVNDATAASLNENEKEDVKFNVTFDPRLDETPPTIDSLSVTEENHQVCTAFTGITGIGSSLLGCSTASTASQFVVDYDVSDSGGSGLDYIRVDVKDSGGDVLLSNTHSLRGASSQGTFVTSQIVHSEMGTPATVDIYVYDRNGKSVSRVDT